MRSNFGDGKLVSIVTSVLLILVILFSFISFIKFNEELNKKEMIIQSLEANNTNLQKRIDSLEAEVKRAKSFLQNISREELRNPTWEELETFLKLDGTNELIYDKEAFDCSGFTIELFKRARAVGIKAGFVEFEFAGETIGHTLNAFQTDKGLVFVDVTGNERGTGKDKVAYVVVGKPYGVIELEGMKERIIDCNIGCRQLTKDLNYVDYPNIFSYDYFITYKKCKNLYETCGSLYNQAVEDYKRGRSEYSYAELSKWYENLMLLKGEITSQDVYLMSESGIVKNVKIYW